MVTIRRQPAVAGSFYPDNKQQLSAEIEDYLSQTPLSRHVPKVLIVPHAGYYYSGRVAGQGYCHLKNIAGNIAKKINRVILLGPSHKVALHGCAVPSCDEFSTSLGSITIDKKACQNLTTKNLAQYNDLSHQWEHSLEVQLPFLQKCLAAFTLIPVVVGDCQPSKVKQLLNALLNEKDQKNISSTLIVISTDLSHYHQYDRAQMIDGNTIDRILALQSNIEAECACGCHALNGLLSLAAEKSWQVRLISKTNSGDVSGDKSRVVGYASFILYQTDQSFNSIGINIEPFQDE